MIKRYEIGTRRRKNEPDETAATRARPFPAAELSRD
jgi:hypothetical protein